MRLPTAYAWAATAALLLAGGELAAQPAAPLELVAEFYDAMPTGVAVAQDGRIFVCFPRWGDPLQFSVAEWVGGRARAYPDGTWNEFDSARVAERFVSVQSVVIDPLERLWVLDTGSIAFAPVLPQAAKLVAIDLATDRVVKTIAFPPDVALPSSYLNDIRFDLRQGREGVAYLTDSSSSGNNAIVVVDLASGRSWRRLQDHPSVRAESQFQARIEGRPLLVDPPGAPPHSLTVGADGIALSADGARLFYSALAGRELYSVSTASLRDQTLSEADVAATVLSEGKRIASDGLESDAQRRIYATDYEHGAIVRYSPDGGFETLAQDPRMLWPDTLALAGDGHLYFIANQVPRMPDYNDGADLRQPPYSLFRIAVDATPIRLR